MGTLNLKRLDLLLLLSLLLVFLAAPELDFEGFRQIVLAVLIFIPVLLASIRLSAIRGWVWPSLSLALGMLAASAASAVSPTPALLATKWVFLTLFFAVGVAGIFSYLRKSQVVSQADLYSAISIYLMLGMAWFALYSVIDVLFPGAIQHGKASPAGAESELLYFSLVTLSTIGYGDIVPIHPEVRMLAALEGVTGVLYIAITVAILVSKFRQSNGPH